MEPMPMHVGLITYQTGHLKTWQLTQKLLAKGHRVTLFAFPFKLRPAAQGASRFADRPSQLIDLDVKSFCARHGVDYVTVDGWSDGFATSLDVGSPDVFLHCIAKIVPRSFIGTRKILNCHPGLLPQNRGVDAFKWSIVNKWPLGVTLHMIDDEIDRGIILRRKRVPVRRDDTLADVCARAYEIEVELMADFANHLPALAKGWSVGDDFPCSHRMIPKEQDDRIDEIFVANRNELYRLARDPEALAHPSDGDADIVARGIPGEDVQ